ncbi:MAG: tetratricopeptide repeat protein [Candidatus Omnitrophota bacterium]
MKKIIELLITSILLIILIYLSLPKAAAFYNNKGIDYYDQGLHEKAVLNFKKSLKIKPFPITYYNLANAYAKLKKESEAAGEYKNSIQAKPENYSPYLALSQIYLNKQMYEEALNLLYEAETKFPAEEEIKKARESVSFEYMLDCANKGVESFLTGKKQEAYFLLNKALEINNSSAYPYYFLGYFYKTDNNYTQGEEILKKALLIKSDFLPAGTLLGDLYYEQNNYKKAISAYKACLAINFDNSYVHNNLGLCFMNIEHYSEAIAHLEKALQFSPNNLNIHYSLASLYRDKGLLDLAIVEYQKILKQLPEYPHIHNDLGDIYLLQNKKNEALKEYSIEIKNCQSRIKAEPDDIDTLNDTAYAYNGIGDYSKAKEIIKKTIKLRPSWRQAYLTLAKIEENLENKNNALEALDKAKSLSAYTDFIDKDIARLKQTISSPAQKSFSFDKIYLKNGRMIEGIIVKETEDKIILRIYVGKSQGITILPKGRIKNIIRVENQ